jgi:predicted dehydrogenase
MIRIGIAGIGFMGMIHFLAARQVRGAQVAAICSRDPKKRAGNWTGIRGNFGPPGAQMDLAGVRGFDSFAALLATPEIDLIDICTPTAQHAAMAIAALDAGKQVLVEKPIALTLADADRMVAAANRNNRSLLVGHVLPFFPEFALLADTIRSQRYGRLLAGSFQRIIARPDWSSAIADIAQTGGPAIDLHIHDTHFIRMTCGMPAAVFATGYVKQDAVLHIHAQYLFADGWPSITCSSGALCQSGRPFMHGYEAYFERGTLMYQSGVTPPTLYTGVSNIETPTLPGSSDPVDCFAAELQAAVDAVGSAKRSAALDGRIARDALALCLAECDSVRERQIVKISGT